MLAGLAATVIVFGTAVCVSAPELSWAVLASVAVMVQTPTPTAVPAVYVTEAFPFESVIATADDPPFRRTPAQPAPAALVKRTASPEMLVVLVLSLTFVDAVVVLDPSAGTDPPNVTTATL
jgi:hypothetical protein